LPKRINLTVDKKKFEMPSDLVIVIGKEKPVIQVR
jgi:ribosomal protein S4E